VKQFKENLVFDFDMESNLTALSLESVPYFPSLSSVLFLLTPKVLLTSCV
jgi:hypothetical protein